MDDLMEMFTLPSWPEINMGKLPWDYNCGTSSSSAMTADTSTGLISNPHKAFTSTSHLMPSRQGIATSQDHAGQDASFHHPHGNAMGQYYGDEAMLTARMNQQQGNQDAFIGSTDMPSMGHSQMDGHLHILPHGMQETTYSVLRRISEGSSRAPGLHRSASIGSSSGGSEISGCQQLSSSDYQSPSSIGSTWCQSYIGGMLSSPLGLAQVKTESIGPMEEATNDAHLVRKRFRDDESRAAPQESMFNSFDIQQFRSTGQQIHPPQVSTPAYANHTGIGHSQGAAAVVAGTARPRVRARRGQATDPHSIAERLRRERIADRMKALQDLVPSASKTDKASMLDEIIEYVRFLQLQMKVFNVSRLGTAGAVGSLVADVPAEGHNHFAATTLLANTGTPASTQDNISATEQQVAKLMEEDMGSALQFIQKKGLCLMPISLATTITTTSNNARPLTAGGGQGALSRRTDSLSSTIMANATAMSTGLLMSTGHMGDQGREPSSAMNNGSKGNIEGTTKTSPL